tara:strand:+ start:363 stop:617 length:255 start_codon:yes stop_codon:yes gene_type:complete
MKKSHKTKKRETLKIRKKTKRVNSSFKKMSNNIKRQNENEKVKLIGLDKMKKAKIHYYPFEHYVHCVMLIFFPFISINFRSNNV